MHSYEFFPEEIKREITNRLDEPTKRLSRSVSTQWHKQKVWCTDEYINDAYILPIRRSEVNDIGFIVIYSENEHEYYEPPSASVRLMILRRNNLITYNLTISYSYQLQGWLRMDSKTETVDVSSSTEAIDIMFSRIDENDMYWLDPFTSLRVAAGRLKDCNVVTDVSVWDFFPWSDEELSSLDGNKKEALRMYIFGYGVLTGRLGTDGFSNVYHYMSDSLEGLVLEVEAQIRSQK